MGVMAASLKEEGTVPEVREEFNVNDRWVKMGETLSEKDAENGVNGAGGEFNGLKHLE